jgi:hypothetical protein
MVHQGWRRFLPDRSQLMLLVIVVIALVAGVSFVNLGIAHKSALAAREMAVARYDEIQQQHVLLVRTLEAAQRGENILPKAYDYFFMTPPGIITVLIEPAEPAPAPGVAGARTSGPPYWGDWWQHLVNP